MKTKLLIPFAAVLALSGCAKEMRETPSGSVTVTQICVNMPQDNGSGARTAIGELSEGKRPIYWETGDMIRANALASDPLEVEGLQSSAVFKFQGIVDYPANILYPSSYYKEGTTITIPAVVQLKPVLPMAAEMAGGSTSVTLKTLTSVIRVPLKLAASEPDTDRLYKISLSSDSAQLNGDFTVDYAAGTMSAAGAGEGLNRQTVMLDTVLTETPIDLFIPVPAGNYALTMKFVDVNGHTMTKSLTRTFEAGKVHTAPETEFVPTSTEIGVEIKSAAQWNAFAADYNDGLLDNIREVKLGADLDFTGLDIVTVENLGCAVTNPDGYAFKNLALSNSSVFGWILAGGSVDGLVLDSSVTLAVTPESSGKHYSPLCIRNYGTVSHCTVASEIDFSFDYGTDSLIVYIGGVAARNYLTIDSCEFSGVIRSNATDETNKYTSEVSAGGIAGYCCTDALISNSVFSGKILVGANAGEDNYTAAGVASESEPTHKFAGICGYPVDATISGCSTSSSALVDIRGKLGIVNVGGIAGQNKSAIVNCTNNATVLTAIDRGDESYARTYIGGIAGNTASTSVISGCENNGPVKCATVCRHNSIGGIAGYLSGRIENTHNTGTVWQGERGPRYIYIGGICGQTSTSDWSGAIYNTGTVNPTRMGNTSTKYNCIGAGGLIGRLNISLDGANTMYNEGLVRMDCTPVKSKGAYEAANAGGIVGVAVSDAGKEIVISNFKNKGRVFGTSTMLAKPGTGISLGGIIGCSKAACTISGCSNEITGCMASEFEDYYDYDTWGVGFNTPKLDTKGYFANTSCAGIIGASSAKVKVLSSDNKSKIALYFKADSTISGRYSFLAGVAGSLTGPGAEITGCTNTGGLFSSNRCSGGSTQILPNIGGIAGRMIGSVSSHSSIKGCQVPGVEIYAYRGVVGGIAGYSSYADIGGEGTAACSMSGTIGGNKNDLYHGGVVGYADTTTVTNCHCRADVSGGANNAGIVGGIGDAVEVSGCTFKGAVSGTVAYAGVAVVKRDNYTITGNGIAGSVAGTAVTSGNLGTLFAPDGVTATGTYLYTE